MGGCQKSICPTNQAGRQTSEEARKPSSKPETNKSITQPISQHANKQKQTNRALDQYLKLNTHQYHTNQRNKATQQPNQTSKANIQPPHFWLVVCLKGTWGATEQLKASLDSKERSREGPARGFGGPRQSAEAPRAAAWAAWRGGCSQPPASGRFDEWEELIVSSSP